MYGTVSFLHKQLKDEVLASIHMFKNTPYDTARFSKKCNYTNEELFKKIEKIAWKVLNNFSGMCIDRGLSKFWKTTLNRCPKFDRSLRAETHLGPDGTRLEQSAQARLKSRYKHAGQFPMKM